MFFPITGFIRGFSSCQDVKSQVIYSRQAHDNIHTFEHPIVIDFLNQEECEEIWSQILKLKSHWKPRYGNVLPIFTLGAASYLDGFDARNYSRQYNDHLMKEFGYLYSKLISTISSNLPKYGPDSYEFGKSFKQGNKIKTLPNRMRQNKVRLKKDAAVPGFHIFLNSFLFNFPVASVHTDRQYLFYKDFNKFSSDLFDPISFTLPIRLPKPDRDGERGGLYEYSDSEEICISSERGEKKKSFRFGDLRRKADDTKGPFCRIFHQYEVGKLILHSGQVLHQIKHGGIYDDMDDMRVTLQGHAVFQNGEWQIYW